MGLSPMMKFYMSLKEQYKDSLLFFRLGDFYEMFFDDAKIASRELDLTLTGRDCGLEERAPMCGVPYHAVDNYISKLISKGYKVAICEQLSDPATSKGMVDRDVVRVITPGTVVEDSILEEKSNNYLACINSKNKEYAIAWIDISTGEFNTLQSKFDEVSNIEDMLSTINPSEIIANDNTCELFKDNSSINLGKYPKIQNYLDWAFEYNSAYTLICKQLECSTLAKFEFEDKKLAIGACGALLNYLNETQKRTLPHISNIKYIKNNNFLILDSNTRRSLELCQSSKDGSKKATLLWALDNTHTNMGARNLKRWIEQPLRNSGEINDRLDATEELVNNSRVRANLIEELSNMKDLERLASRLAYGNTNPRDIVAIKQSLESIPNIKSLLNQCNSKLLNQCNDAIYNLDNIRKLIEDSFEDNPPAVIKDGGFIKKGFNEELDKLRRAKSEGKDWLAQLESKEREETGIKTLKIGYNKVFGYYIEISKGSIDKAPLRYQRKQTLTNGERYITPELKDIEETLLGAHEKSVVIEQHIFEQVKYELLKMVPDLLSTARNIAIVDTIVSFACDASNNNYCKPTINDKIDQINIIDGRHPVIELLTSKNGFVPNDTMLDSYSNRTMIITGPNMAGKSTYMRQVALIAIMAHIGCFVPAKKAEISILDRIFTRIGASDDLAYGQSTFMVEMVEVATILQNATFRSLLILDEIGRGTSTFDGLSIARAVMEDISTRIRCKTMFSTHYHELTELEGMLEGVRNYKILATERDKGIVFLHKIAKGGTNKSFGIEVAKLAGLPNQVILNAKKISKLLEHNPLSTLQELEELPLLEEVKKNDNTGEEIVNDLKNIDIDMMSPMQALIKLSELVKKAKD